MKDKKRKYNAYSPLSGRVGPVPAGMDLSHVTLPEYHGVSDLGVNLSDISPALAEEAEYQRKLKLIMDNIDDDCKYTPGEIGLMEQAAKKMLEDGMKESLPLTILKAQQAELKQKLIDEGVSEKHFSEETYGIGMAPVAPFMGAIDRIQEHSNALLSKALRAICFMRDYCPSDMPAIKGWEWFDVGSEIAKAIPHDEWAHEFRNRVEIDLKHREIAEQLRTWLDERTSFYNANFYHLKYEQFIEDSTMNTPMCDVNQEFFKQFRNDYGVCADWLLKCNVIRIIDIMTEDDQAKAFEEHEVEG